MPKAKGSARTPLGPNIPKIVATLIMPAAKGSARTPLGPTIPEFQHFCLYVCQGGIINQVDKKS